METKEHLQKLIKCSLETSGQQTSESLKNYFIKQAENQQIRLGNLLKKEALSKKPKKKR